MKRYWAVWVQGLLATVNVAVALFIADGWWRLANVAAAVFVGALGVLIFRDIQSSLRTKEAVMSTSGYWNNIGYHTPAYPRMSFTPTVAPRVKKPEGAGEFKGLPFDLAIGEVYGMRMWHLDQYGRLRARNWNGVEPWRPGVNVAKCRARDSAVWDAMHRAFGSAGSVPPDPPTPKPEHDAPSEDCQCGFYAYTDSLHAETMPYKNNGESVILGIIKGTGRTLVGTKGFRCEKAEIVAFRDPTRGGTKTDPWRLRQLANLKRVYPDVPILESRAALLEFAPLTDTMPDPSTDEFWEMP